MISNWLDIVILVILLATFILGVIKGFVRQIIGIIAVVVGLILAAKYYYHFSRVISRAVAVERWSHLIAFLIIFFVVLAVGGLIAFLASKLMVGPLRFLDHLLGGAIGLIKGVLISGVVVFALLIFPVDKEALKRSVLAPYCYWMTSGMVHLIPQELKDQFRETYKEIVESTRRHGQKI